MRHFFFVVYYCMVVAQGHSQPFNHIGWMPRFPVGYCNRQFSVPALQSVFQTRAGGFRTVTVMPVCVIEYIAKLDSLVPV